MNVLETIGFYLVRGPEEMIRTFHKSAKRISSEVLEKMKNKASGPVIAAKTQGMDSMLKPFKLCKELR